MKNKSRHSNFNPGRRRFISACGFCTACLATAPLHRLGALTSVKQKEKIKIRIIYSLHAPKQPQPDWPNIDFDFVPAMNRITSGLIEKCEGFEFLTSMATGPGEAESIIGNDAVLAVDGYLVYQMNCWNQVVQTVAKTGKPVLYADFQFGGSGGFLVYNAGFIRNSAPNIGFVASSRPDDLTAAVRCFEIVKNGGSTLEFSHAVAKTRIQNTPGKGNLTCITDPLVALPVSLCMEQMKKSKILVARDTSSGTEPDFMTIPVEKISFAEVNAAFNSASREKAGEIAERWIRNAMAVVDVPRETIEGSAAMYLGMKTVLENHQANAITINCLGGFYGGHIHAYPCLGFHELNNEGLVGACEADVESTATMVAFSLLSGGRPGYISDPVIDTSKRQIIYAHCVAPNKVFGPGMEANPYYIMTHSEDHQGASVRSLLPVGYKTTTLKVNNDRKEIIFHQAIAVDNDPDDRACRTKLCAEPLGDIEKLFTQWDQWGWHRVTFYGDLKGPVTELADTLGYKIIEEA